MSTAPEDINADGGHAQEKKTISLAERFAENYDSDDDDGLQEEKKLGFKDYLNAFLITLKRVHVYSGLALTDARARKGGYCLGFMSVFVVVLITVLMFTIMGNLPILFLKLGEQEEGIIDLMVFPGGQVYRAHSLNYTLVEDRFPTGDNSYHTPRITFEMQAFSTHVNCKGHDTLTSNITQAWYPNSKAVVSAAPTPAPGNLDGNLGGNTEDADKVATTCTPRDGCISEYCSTNESQLATLFFIDEEKEDRMELGTGTFPSLGPNECMIEKALAEELELVPGNDLIVAGQGPAAVLLQAFINADLVDRQDVFRTSDNAGTSYTTYRNSIMTLKVVGIMDDNMMKIPDSVSRYIFLSYKHSMETIATSLSPVVKPSRREAFRTSDPKHMATQILFNFPPSRRNDIYVNTDYDVTQRKATNFASNIIAPMGFNQVDIEMPIIASLFTTRFFSLFMGLLLSLIITTLSFLSIVLQYSLLSVNLSTRQFELGVMRMLGFNKGNLVGLVLTNAYFFAIPAWAVGLALGQVVFLLVRGILPVELPPLLTPDSIGYATLAGLALPALASLAPMLNVLSQNLPNLLDVDRSRIEAVEIHIERGGQGPNWTVVGLGLVLAVFGFCIYYLFPLALVNFNLTLLFYIFFGLLLGLLFGLILLAVNFERLFETVISYMFFWWWENTAVFQLIGKNLTAHRRRNRKTTLMFSCAIGFIIFITVAFQIQITSSIFRLKQRMGGEVFIDGEENFLTFDEIRLINQELFESEALSNISNSDKKMTYVTANLQDLGIVNNATIETLGRYAQTTLFPVGCAPGFLDVVDDEFIVFNDRRKSPWDMVEYLYSEEGSGMAVNPTTLKEALALDSLHTQYLIITNTLDSNRTERSYRDGVAQTAAFADTTPVTRFSKFPQVQKLNQILSIPSILTKTRGSLNTVRNLKFQGVVIRVPSGDSGTVASHFSERLSAWGSRAEVEDYEAEADSVRTTVSVVDVFFIFTQVMASVICYFALSSSMSTNIFEQTKEIGVMRCIGLRKFPCYRVYMWESYTLVVGASIMGLVVGTVVAYTMTLQQMLFSQLPLPFVFPTFQLVTVLISSFVIAFLASFFPLRLVLNLPSITAIIRKVG